MVTYDDLFANNRRWAKERLAQDPQYFVKLSREQKPDYLYIGCADSRVPANEIAGLEPGEVFVHRNIANLVNNIDLNAMSVIEYAVKVLDVKHIVVCGHYQCGGILAAMQAEDMGLLNPWLRNIRDIYRLHQQELEMIANKRERYDRLVELNVTEQCINVIKIAAVQQSFAEKGYPLVHGWVFSLTNGQLVDLKVNFKEKLAAIQKIYNITGKQLF